MSSQTLVRVKAMSPLLSMFPGSDPLRSALIDHCVRESFEHAVTSSAQIKDSGRACVQNAATFFFTDHSNALLFAEHAPSIANQLALAIRNQLRNIVSHAAGASVQLYFQFVKDGSDTTQQTSTILKACQVIMLSEAGQELGVNGYMLSEVQDEPTWPWRHALRMWKEAHKQIFIDANREGGKNGRNYNEKTLSEGLTSTRENRERKRTVRFVSRQVRTENPREGVELNTVGVVFEACERIENDPLKLWLNHLVMLRRVSF